MKAIILAAGMGTRLGKYTENLPKGMLNFNGKSLIQRQVETLKLAGINNIIIVTGYMSDKIKIEVKYYKNEEYAETNMVATLMKAEVEFDDDILVCYSDIMYEKRLVEEILKSKADVSVLVDDSWIDYWKARSETWTGDVESLNYDENSKIFDIGNTKCNLEDAKSRYIGIIKFSKAAINTFKDIFYENKAKFWDKNEPWMKSKSFKKAYMTCMLQFMINQGVDVRAVHVEHGWMEFDTEEDYEKAVKWLSEGSINKLIKLDD